MNNKVIQVIYDDDDVLLAAVKKVKAANYQIEEVYTPFPVHGLDKAMGLAPTRLAIASFFYGCIGLGVASVMMYYMMIVDDLTPHDIGGKPSFTFLDNMPSFVPIMFEMTVFFAAHLMVITFYLRSKLWPFKKAENPDVRTTDDHFLMEVAVDSDSIVHITELLKETGMVEIKLAEKE